MTHMNLAEALDRTRRAVSETSDPADRLRAARDALALLDSYRPLIVQHQVDAIAALRKKRLTYREIGELIAVTGDRIRALLKRKG